MELSRLGELSSQRHVTRHSKPTKCGDVKAGEAFVTTNTYLKKDNNRRRKIRSMKLTIERKATFLPCGGQTDEPWCRRSGDLQYVTSIFTFCTNCSLYSPVLVQYILNSRRIDILNCIKLSFALIHSCELKKMHST